jgi:DNA-binding CsgD family transcriptional regulator
VPELQGGDAMCERMDGVQRIKQERNLRGEYECVKEQLKSKEKELLIAETRLIQEVKEKRRALDRIISLEKELKSSFQELYEIKTTLKVVIEQRLNDTAKFDEKIIFNLRDTTVSYIEHLKNRIMDRESRLCLEMIETNIKKALHPLIHTKIPYKPDLSPTEIRVATLVSEGKTTKEISSLLIMSDSTIEYHRNSIREKLGIKNRKVNLKKYLSSLYRRVQ